MKRKEFVKFVLHFILVVVLVFFISGMEVALGEDSTKMGGIKVSITDENGDEVCGAKVFVCEISKCFETGKNGQTTCISVPIVPDKRFLEICKKDFGEITLLVTKDGFCPTCVTGVIVRDGVTRLGPKIILKSGSEYRHVADSIDQSWLKKFCEKFM